jgi:HEAT repeat protein
MFTISRQISFWSKVFNVKGDEWPKILFSWLVRFFYRLGFVLIWTVVVGQFVTNYGIAALPYLFVFTAFFTLLGSLGSSTVVDRFSPKKMMVVNVLIAALVIAVTPVFFSPDEPLFIGLLMVTVVLFLKQFRLILGGYLEELFSPLQSERTFPLIEAADTIAGVVAGILLATLVDQIELVGLLNIASLSLIVIAPLLFTFVFPENVEEDRERSPKRYGLGVYSSLKAQFRDRTYLKFLKGLILLILLQWFLFNILEFQYTKAVYSKTSSVASDYGSGFEHAFIHDLGQLFALFSSLALLFQLFIGSRMISNLGIFGSSVVHAIVSFFSFIAMMANFNFSVSVFAKTNFTVTSVLHNNAYHSAYYGVHRESRARAREFLEGMVRPVGAILGTLCLIIFQNILSDLVIDFYLNLLMVLIAGVLFFVAYKQQRFYTNVAVATLKDDRELHEKLMALEILSQNGHKNGHNILRSVIFDTSLPIEARVLAVKSLSNFNSSLSLPILFEVVALDKNEGLKLQFAAVAVISSLGELNPKEISFSRRYTFLNHVKLLYLTENADTDFLGSLFSILRYFPDSTSVEILSFALNSDVLAHRLVAIRTLGFYDDSAINMRLSKYLDSPVLDEAVMGAIALYNSPNYGGRTRDLLDRLMSSDNSSEIGLGIFACGELKLVRQKKALFQFLKSPDLNVRVHAAIALGKLGHRDGVHLILAVVMSDDFKLSIKVLQLIATLESEVRLLVNRLLREMVVGEIESIKSNGAYSDLSEQQIVRLRALYYILGYSDEKLIKVA